MKNILRKIVNAPRVFLADPLDFIELLKFNVSDTKQANHFLERPLRPQTINKTQLNARSCVILGSGQGALDLDIQRCLQQKIAIIALNGAYRLLQRHDVRADMLVISDPYFAAEQGKEAAAWAKETCVSSAAYARSRALSNPVLIFKQWKSPMLGSDCFQTDLTKPLYNAMSVAHPALQIAVAAGATNILFAGVDFISDPQKPHFYTGVQENEKRSAAVFAQTLETMLAGMKGAQEWLDEHKKNVRVRRLHSPSSNNPFPPIHFDDFIKEEAAL